MTCHTVQVLHWLLVFITFKNLGCCGPEMAPLVLKVTPCPDRDMAFSERIFVATFEDDLCSIYPA